MDYRKVIELIESNKKKINNNELYNFRNLKMIRVKGTNKFYLQNKYSGDNYFSIELTEEIPITYSFCSAIYFIFFDKAKSSSLKEFVEENKNSIEKIKKIEVFEKVVSFKVKETFE